MDLLNFIEELQALEALDQARKELEQMISSGVTTQFPDPKYEEKLSAFLLAVGKSRRAK